MKNNKLLDKITGTLLTAAAKFHEESSIKLFSNQPSPKDWPAEWKRIHFKSYPRLKQVSLTIPKINSKNNLFQAILQRKSSRDFNSYAVTKGEVSKLLFFSAGMTNRLGDSWDGTTRAYPSAGARYPLEVYPVILNSTYFESGLYHYNVKGHSLELLLPGQLIAELKLAINQEWVDKASVVFVITSVLGRSQIKYGDRAYRHALLEAGHLAQNIYLVATTMGVRCCAIGGFIDNRINSLLDLNEENEFAVYMLAIGK